MKIDEKNPEKAEKKKAKAQSRLERKKAGALVAPEDKSYYYRPVKTKYDWLKERLTDIAYENEEIKKILLADYKHLVDVSKIEALRGEEVDSQTPEDNIAKL
jgi:hypothetical protein